MTSQQLTQARPYQGTILPNGSRPVSPELRSRASHGALMRHPAPKTWPLRSLPAAVTMAAKVKTVTAVSAIALA
jgi:hypothetical protein